MKLKLIIAILLLQCNQLYANEYIFKMQKISNIKEIKQENNNPICGINFGACENGTANYISNIGDSEVIWKCISHNIEINCSKTALNGTNGVCGSSNNEFLEEIPLNLCNSGTATTVYLNNSTYNWVCNGSEATQISKEGNSVNCSATKVQNAKWSNFNVLVSRSYYDFNSIRTSSETYIPSNGVCKPVGDSYGELCTYENNGNLELELKITRAGCFYGSTSNFDGYVMHNITGLKSYEVLSGNLNVDYVNQNNKFGFNLSGKGCVDIGDSKKVKLIF